jgi:hypothetical protein
MVAVLARHVITSTVDVVSLKDLRNKTFLVLLRKAAEEIRNTTYFFKTLRSKENKRACK